MIRLSKRELVLVALLFDVAFAAGVVALCIADKITGTTAMTVLVGQFMARKRPVSLDDDDDDDAPPAGARSKRSSSRHLAVSGVLTLFAGLLWAAHWLRQKVGA